MVGREDFSDWYSEWNENRKGRGRSVHEQRDETILSMAVFSKNDNHSAEKWIQYLQQVTFIFDKPAIFNSCFTEFTCIGKNDNSYANR